MQALCTVCSLKPRYGSLTVKHPTMFFAAREMCESDGTSGFWYQATHFWFGEQHPPLNGGLPISGQNSITQPLSGNMFCSRGEHLRRYLWMLPELVHRAWWKGHCRRLHDWTQDCVAGAKTSRFIRGLTSLGPIPFLCCVWILVSVLEGSSTERI